MVQPLNQPLNYTLNVPNPAEAVTAGLQQGVQLASMMERADAIAAQRQQTQVETQLMQAKAQREQAQRDAIAAYYDTPPEKRTAAMFERIQATAPKEVAENMRASFDALTKEQQRQKLLTGAQVFSALRSGDRETANTILRQQADAARNAGDEAGARAFENAAEMAAIAPDQAELFVGTSLAALPGGKEFLENVSKQSEMRTKEAMAPGQIAKAIAEGKTAEIIANTEQKMRDAEIALKGAQTTSAKASAGASYASAKKTLREIKRIDALEPGEVRKLAAEADKLEAEAREKRGEMSAQGAVDAGQRVLDTVALLRGDTKDAQGNVQRGNFGIIKRIAGPITGRAPTLTGPSSDAENAIATLKDQVFLSQIKQMKGMGALSEKEGDRLASSIANLSLTQSPERLQKNIEYIEQTMAKGMERARQMTGGTAAAAPSGDVRAQADAILRGGK